jgi:hypothetical protein
MSDILKWLEAQFNELGQGVRSYQLASYFLSGIQGMNLLTLTFKEPQYMQKQSQSLQEWLATV